MGDLATLLLGTTKGLFILRPAADGIWQVDGPFCDGWGINHAIGDARGRIWAAGGGDWHGAGVWRFEDNTWHLSKLADGQVDDWLRNDPEFAAFMGREADPPAPFSGEAEAIWSLGLVGERLFAGAKPGRLYVSEDGGQSWEANLALNDHPSRESWAPGAAGLTLHTIVSAPDTPNQIWLAMSAAGVFASDDGGASWERRNRLTNAGTCPGHAQPTAPGGGETGHCVHNMMRASNGTLYQQNHQGVYSSQDGGRSWEDITDGLPSSFGFPIAVHPSDPSTLWTLPLNGDSAGRFPPGAAAAVWRSRDGGSAWSACRAGLPQTGCFFTVLRQAMAVAADTRAGLYFGTNSGSVFASFDDGDTWHEIARHLPTILSVETMTATS